MIILNMEEEMPNVQAGFRKGRSSRDNIANLCWLLECLEKFQGDQFALCRLQSSL